MDTVELLAATRCCPQQSALLLEKRLVARKARLVEAADRRLLSARQEAAELCDILESCTVPGDAQKALVRTRPHARLWYLIPIFQTLRARLDSERRNCAIARDEIRELTVAALGPATRAAAAAHLDAAAALAPVADGNSAVSAARDRHLAVARLFLADASLGVTRKRAHSPDPDAGGGSRSAKAACVDGVGLG